MNAQRRIAAAQNERRANKLARKLSKLTRRQRRVATGRRDH